MPKATQHVYLLTGATGLVGRYLLAELLQRCQPVVTIVRARNQQHAQQRVERALKHCEANRRLPRPGVLVGDLSSVAVLSDVGTLQPLKGASIVVIHCAASIRFDEDAASGEPYATNVNGTKNLLQLCTQLNVVEFHYVSTAYVGCRTGRAPLTEQPVDGIELGGNAYEKSKIEAEHWVRASGLPAVIHRPSIVVGDSRTGFTSTFHGFYAPLQIAVQIAKQFGFSDTAGDWFRQQLGLQPSDMKNLVPVDWLAACIAHVVVSTDRNASEQRPPNPRIFHWTNSRPVRCQDLQDAIVGSIKKYFSCNEDQKLLAVHLAQDVPGQFRSLMSVYASYFNNDPVFDASHAREACPQLPCPEVNMLLLKRLAEFAIENNFGWPKSAFPELPHQQLLAVLNSLPPWSNQDLVANLQIDLLGCGSPQRMVYGQGEGGWFWVNGGSYSEECNSRPLGVEQLSCTLPIECLADFLVGASCPAVAIMQGYLLLCGSSEGCSLGLFEDWLYEIACRITVAAVPPRVGS